jgi:hypothetical protein
MGKPTNGPDEVDVMTMMRAMGALHSGRVSVLFTPRGIGSDTTVDVVASMEFDVLPGSSLPPLVSSIAPWPCKTCKSFWGHVYNGLYTLDQKIGEVYEQKDMWDHVTNPTAE